MPFNRRVFAQPLITDADPTPTQLLAAGDTEIVHDLSAEERLASEVLIRHLFANVPRAIDGIEYHVEYALAEGAVGGDIVDVYHFDNGNVALSIADISGKGATAAIHAALVKYGLRCYTSEGLTAERVLRSLDRAYIENNAFERTESFASVFLGILDHDRRAMTYACAGHEPVLLCHPHDGIEVLTPTAPLIGVFDDQHHLFKQRHVEIVPGTILVATTDGVTEARSASGELFGMDRLISSARRAVVKASAAKDVTDSLLIDVDAFCGGQLRDDIAMLAVRIF